MSMYVYLTKYVSLCVCNFINKLFVIYSGFEYVTEHYKIAIEACLLDIVRWIAFSYNTFYPLKHMLILHK
jgi:methyl coenzyme M reductase alpha subunit